MKINVNLFYSHNLDERMEIVNERGQYITRIKYYGFYVNLYIINSLYVEVYYNIHSNKIEEVELIDSTNIRLALYVEGIDLSKIV